MPLEQLWAGWRYEYVQRATEQEREHGEAGAGAECVFCRIAAEAQRSHSFHARCAQCGSRTLPAPCEGVSFREEAIEENHCLLPHSWFFISGGNVANQVQELLKGGPAVIA